MLSRKLVQTLRFLGQTISHARSPLLETFPDEQDSRQTLDNLPVEILLCVADELAIADVVSLSLSNRLLKMKLGPRCLAAFTSQGHLQAEGNADALKSRHDFLTRVARNDGRYYLCHTCDRLHLTKAIGPPIWAEKCGPHPELWLRNYHPHDVLRSHGDLATYLLYFEHVQCVMERYRRGIGFGHSLGMLQACEISDPCASNDVTTLLSVEAQIIDDELYLRIQQWFAFASGQLTECANFEHVSVCGHFNNRDSTLQPILNCKLRHHGAHSDCCSCHSYMMCTRCKIEFNINTRDLGSDGNAVVITKRARLGHGLSPSDPHWESFALDDFEKYERDLWAHQSAHNGRITPSFSEKWNREFSVHRPAHNGRIHERFERQAAQGMNALTDEHALLLRGKAYRRSFTYAGSGTWPRFDDVWIAAPQMERDAHRYAAFPRGIYRERI